MTEQKITADGDYAMKLKDAFFLKKKKSTTVSIVSPSISHEVMDRMP